VNFEELRAFEGTKEGFTSETVATLPIGDLFAKSWSNIVAVHGCGIIFNAGDDIVAVVYCKSGFGLGNPETKIGRFERCKSSLLGFAIGMFV